MFGHNQITCTAALR